MLGTLHQNDLEPCKPMVSDKGKRMADAINADAENRGRYIQCQHSQFALLQIVRDLIDASVLQVIDSK